MKTRETGTILITPLGSTWSILASSAYIPVTSKLHILPFWNWFVPNNECSLKINIMIDATILLTKTICTVPSITCKWMTFIHGTGNLN
jgi:hypothetical protein